MRAKFALAALTTVMLTAAPAFTRAADEGPPAAVTPSPAPVATKFTVQVIGAVKKPGKYVFDEGARLSDALAAAGMNDVDTANGRAGIPIDSLSCTFGGGDLHRVFLTRTVDSSRSLSYMIDVALARQRQDLRYDPLLRANDRILVPECRRSGPIFTPPMFPPGLGRTRVTVDPALAIRVRPPGHRPAGPEWTSVDPGD